MGFPTVTQLLGNAPVQGGDSGLSRLGSAPASRNVRGAASKKVSLTTSVFNQFNSLVVLSVKGTSLGNAVN